MTINPNLTVNEFLDSVDFGSSLSLSFPELQSKYQELSGKSLDVPSAIDYKRMSDEDAASVRYLSAQVEYDYSVKNKYRDSNQRRPRMTKVVLKADKYLEFSRDLFRYRHETPIGKFESSISEESKNLIKGFIESNGRDWFIHRNVRDATHHLRNYIHEYLTSDELRSMKIFGLEDELIDLLAKEYSIKTILIHKYFNEPIVIKSDLIDISDIRQMQIFDEDNKKGE